MLRLFEFTTAKFIVTLLCEQRFYFGSEWCRARSSFFITVVRTTKKSSWQRMTHSFGKKKIKKDVDRLLSTIALNRISWILLVGSKDSVVIFSVIYELDDSRSLAIFRREKSVDVDTLVAYSIPRMKKTSKLTEIQVSQWWRTEYSLT